ncbi:MAG: hypothetical protein ACLQBJ_02240 [Bryobacteraceae bacterium]
MIRMLTVFLLAASALFAQTLEKADLLKQIEELEGVITAGDWVKAAELSRALKSAVTEARNHSLASEGSQLVDSILDWLPSDTETLVVAQEPFPITKPDQTSIPTALQMAQGYVLGLLYEAEKGDLSKALLGRTVRLAAIGARRFGSHPPNDNSPGRLGMIDYEGCAVYAFAEPLSESILPRPSGDAVMGHRVWISKGTENDRSDSETYLVSLLQPDLMTVCNNREFLQQLISRMGSAQHPRALLASLPEWKQVDRTAPLWAISHYGAEGVLANPLEILGDTGSGPAPTGIALAFGLSSGVTKARIISKSDPWEMIVNNEEFHGAAESRKVADGVWELSVAGKPEAGMITALALMAMVGFVVAI